MNKEKTIEKLNKNNCCGCSACVQKCPVKAIEMKENEEGFMYPEIDKNKCINCGLCANVCPQLVYTEEKREDFPIAYACYNNNTDELLKSSSGGVFSAIANYVLENNGLVIGAAFDSKLNLKHIDISTKEELDRLRGSKYLQSDINGMYKKAEEELKNNRLVLFTGTPCQIAGLKTYLMKDYDNLITADLVCHGVPNQKIFSKYIEYLENKYKSKIKSYNFRSKEKKGWGLTARIETEDGKVINKNSSFDPYYNAFLQCEIYRENCYNCKYTSFYRASDITMADYWGVLAVHPEFYSEKGVSLLLINTKRGQKIFDIISNKVKYIKTDIEKAARKNMNLKRPSNRPERRENVYKYIDEKDCKKFVKENLKLKIKPQALIKSLIPYKLKLLIKKAGSKNND